MKKLYSLFIMIILLLPVMAQNNEDEFGTLFGDADIRISGFGGPMMNFSSINNQFAHMMGGGGGVIINDFFIGGFGLGNTNNITANNMDYNLELGYGGIWTGYTFYGRRAIHPVFYTLIGWGSITENTPDNNPLIEDDIFLVTPAVEVEFNITRYFRIGVSGNYRIVFGTGLPRYTNNEFSSPAALLSFKFGWFD